MTVSSLWYITVPPQGHAIGPWLERSPAMPDSFPKTSADQFFSPKSPDSRKSCFWQTTKLWSSAAAENGFSPRNCRLLSCIMSLMAACNGGSSMTHDDNGGSSLRHDGNGGSYLQHSGNEGSSVVYRQWRILMQHMGNKKSPLHHIIHRGSYTHFTNKETFFL